MRKAMIFIFAMAPAALAPAAMAREFPPIGPVVGVSRSDDAVFRRDLYACNSALASGALQSAADFVHCQLGAERIFLEMTAQHPVHFEDYAVRLIQAATDYDSGRMTAVGFRQRYNDIFASMRGDRSWVGGMYRTQWTPRPFLPHP